MFQQIQRLGWLVVSIIVACLPLSSNAQTVPDIEAYMQRVMANGFHGAVLVARDGVVIHQSGYGVADDATGEPITSATVFDSGSIAKQFTAFAILQLEEQGLLSVNDSISRFFPTIPPDKTGITIHHLLTHTAGLTSDHSESDMEPINRDEAVARILTIPLLSEPGSAYAYSNSGYSLLAAIVEEVSGQEFQAYLHAQLFEPAGMSHTGFYNEPQWSGAQVADTYLDGNHTGNPATFPGPYWGVLGNGEVLSTVEDMALWFQTLQAHTLLSAEQTEKLWMPYVAENEESFYGYGWVIEDGEWGRIIWHDGGGMGGNSHIAYYPDHDLLVITMSNRIVYRTLIGDVPYDVQLPATETGTQLAENIIRGDFTPMPNVTFDAKPFLWGGGVIIGVAIVGGLLRLYSRAPKSL